MQQILLMLHVLVAICLIALVLIQHGKGADMGAAFGSGASQTVFGSQGANSFLFKLTAGLAVVFFVTSLVLTHLAAHPSTHTTVALPAVPVEQAPATQTPAAAKLKTSKKQHTKSQ